MLIQIIPVTFAKEEGTMIELSKKKKDINEIKDKIETPTRELHGTWKIITSSIAILMSIIFLYTAGFGTFQALIQRSVFLLFSTTLVFLIYPFSKKQKRGITWLDILLVNVSILSFGWILFDFERIAWRLVYVEPLKNFDYIFGILAIIIVLEANRRVMGWSLVSITIAALIFNFTGPYIPGVFSHSSCTLRYFIDHVYLTTEGLFSSITGIASTYIIIFIAFGAFMDVSGMGQFLLDFCNALTGKQPGGAAKTAVLSSAMLGSISGSGVANTVTTGAFTIPLMMKTGYSPEEAGAIEASASCGGQMLPPVMGAGAFVMAEFTGIPYVDIVKVSIIPALMYFGIVYLFVHIKAEKNKAKGLTEDQIIPITKIIKQGGHLLIPVFLLVYLLLKGYTPFYAGFMSIVSIIPLSFLSKKTRLGPKGFLMALDLAAKRTIGMATASACAGLILGVVTQTGFGVRMGSVIISIAQNNLFLTVIMVFVVSYILGMGLTVVTAYIIASVLAVPALVQLGVPVLVAHLVVFWFCQTSNVTPPVCLAAFAGAAISGGSPTKTGFQSLKISSGMILIPILFVFTPLIFLSYNTTFLSVTWFTFTTSVAFILYVFAIEGYLGHPLNTIERFLLGFTALLLYLPTLPNKLVGFFLLIIYFVIIQKYFRNITKKIIK